MTNTGLDEEFGDKLSMEFISSNAYYSSPFPENFDVTVMSHELLKFSLKKVGFDEVVNIDFPEHLPAGWSRRHKCYLGIRTESKQPSIFEFSRSPDRCPVSSTDADTSMSLAFAGKNANVVVFKKIYYVIPHGDTPSELDLPKNYQPINSYTVALSKNRKILNSILFNH